MARKKEGKERGPGRGVASSKRSTRGSDKGPGSGRGVLAAATAREIPGWVAPVTLALLTLFLFRAIVFGGETFVSPDATAPLGFVKVGEQALYQESVYPLWNPYVFCGMPSFASLAYNPQNNTPDWPLALVQKLLQLTDITWLLLYYFLGALGIYLLCREWGTGLWSALFAGIAFLFMPNLMAIGAHGHGSQLVNSAYIPWILWLTARLFRRGKLEDVAWLALALGFQLLRGHVQICYYTWLTVGLYALFEIFRRQEQPLAAKVKALRLGGLGLSLGLGASLAAFLYLPVREYARHSIRGSAEGGGVAFDYATAWSFTPLESLTFLVPGAVGFGGATYWGTMPFTDYPHYMGLGVLALAIIGVARFRRQWVLGFLIALGLAAWLVSFGKHGFLYPLFYDFLPYFNKFRVPVMVLILLQLATVTLAAFGLDALLDRNNKDERSVRRTDWALMAMFGVAVLVFLSGMLPDLWRSSYEASVRSMRPEFAPQQLNAAFAGATSDALRVGVFALVSLAAAWLYRRGAFPAMAFLTLLALATITDLWMVDRRIVDPVLGPPGIAERATGRDDVIDFLTQQSDSGQFRILPLQEFQSNRFAGFAIASLGGYHAAKPRISQEYIAAEAHFVPFRSLLQGRGWEGDGFLNAANVKYLIVPSELPAESGLREVHRGSQLIYENPSALPRTSLTTAYQVLPVDEHLGVLTQPGYDASSQVLLAEDPGVPPGRPGGPGGSVEITRYGLNSVTMQAEAPAPAILRFADLYFDGWTVRIDGEPAKLLRADHAFRAVVLPAGRHQVEWRYESRAFRQGMVVAIAAMILILALFALGWWRRRAS